MNVKGRRQEYVEATRAALLDSARELFTRKGFTSTSLDEVAAGARLTKGALYHHFTNKQHLFEEVLERVNDQVVDAVLEAGSEAADPWARLDRGLEAFLDACLDPGYQKIGLQQAPAVLGWQRCRELEARMRDLLNALLVQLSDEGETRLDASPLLTRMLFRMLSEAALAIGEAEDQKAVRAEVGTLVRELLRSLRA